MEIVIPNKEEDRKMGKYYASNILIKEIGMGKIGKVLECKTCQREKSEDQNHGGKG